MKARRVIITKEVLSELSIKKMRAWEIQETSFFGYKVKKIQINVVKEGGKK